MVRGIFWTTFTELLIENPIELVFEKLEETSKTVSLIEQDMMAICFEAFMDRLLEETPKRRLDEMFRLQKDWL